jgi:hypothetical protein
LIRVARGMPARGPATWLGEPPRLGRRIPVGVSARASRLNGRLPALSRSGRDVRVPGERGPAGAGYLVVGL